MLSAYENRLTALRGRTGAPGLVLPFVPAQAARVASASGRLDDLVLRRGASPRIPIAERGILPPKAPAVVAVAAAAAPVLAAAPTPVAAPAMSPLAIYLRANLTAMKRVPGFAAIIPASVTSIAEEAPAHGVVYLLDARQQILGRIAPHQEFGAVVRGKYVFAPLDRAIDGERPFELDFSKPVAVRSAALTPASAAPLRPTLIEPIRPVTAPDCSGADPAASCHLRPGSLQ